MVWEKLTYVNSGKSQLLLALTSILIINVGRKHFHSSKNGTLLGATKDNRLRNIFKKVNLKINTLAREPS